MRSVRSRTFLLLALASLASALAADEHSRLERLQSMPRERRLELREKLKEFDALDSGQQSRIRTLDEQLQALPASDRQRLYVVMRAYHDWLGTLPEKARRKIRQAGPSSRIDLINEIRSRQEKARPGPENSTHALQVSSLVGDNMPRQTAVELKFWFSLDPEQRSRLLGRANPDRQRAEFRQLASESDAFNRIHGEHERQVRLELAALRDNMKNRKPGLAAWLRPFEIPKVPPRDRVDSLRRAAELLFLSEFDPKPVAQYNLSRFVAALPPWVLSDAEALPPDAARRRLRILYRLTFPAPEELPGPSAPPKDRPQPEQVPSPPPGTSTPL